MRHIGGAIVGFTLVLMATLTPSCVEAAEFPPLSKVDFSRTLILSGKSEPDYVATALVGDLCSVLRSFSDREISIQTAPTFKTGGEQPTAVIIAGKEALAGLPEDSPRFEFTDKGLGKEGFILKSAFSQKQDRHYFMLAGSRPAGTKFAVLEFVRLLRFAQAGRNVPLPLDVRQVPYFARRGMYGHLHWAYKYPYACRSWSDQDWLRYLDLLSQMKLNLLQVWTMVGILPHPLSDADREYLRKYSAVVDYAHAKRGMEIWLGDCANNVAESDKGMPIEKREYFEVEVLKDPGDPKQFREIMASREDLYRTLPDADAYWIIDSDPGGWKGSPASELVNIFVGHRALMDRFCRRPKQQPLIYWMWFGWGTKSQKDNWRDVITGLQERLREPWFLSACNLQHIALLKEMGLTHKAICFPYGAVEFEPSPPMTVFQEYYIRESARVAKADGLMGLMGNSQTPAVQLPDIYLLSRLAWNPEDPASFDQVLDDLSAQLDPRNPLVLARAWKALKGNDAGAMLAAKENLRYNRDIKADAEPDGTLAWFVPGGKGNLHADLRELLTIKASAVRFAERIEKGDLDNLKDELFEYVDSLLSWTERTGYHGGYLVYGHYRDAVVEPWKRLCKSLGETTAKDRFVQPVYARLKEKHPKDQARKVLEDLVGKLEAKD